MVTMIISAIFLNFFFTGITYAKPTNHKAWEGVLRLVSLDSK